MTGRAVAFILIAVFLFFLGGATNVGWVRVVDSVMWGMLGLSLLLQWVSVSAIDVRRRLGRLEHTGDGPGPMEDDVAGVELELHNQRFWPRFFLSISYDAPMEQPESRWQRFFVANLHGRSRLPLSSRVQCYRRGLHHLGRVTVESLVPFGLFRRRKHSQAPLSLLVYPKAYPMSRLKLIEGVRGASDQSQRARSGLEIVGARQFYPGDPLRHIHWRNTARLRTLSVKEMEDTAERSLAIVFDPRVDLGQGRESTLEYSIKLAASVGLFALKQGRSVRLAAGRVQGEWSDAEPFLRELALLDSNGSPGIGALLQSVQRSSSVISIVASADAEGSLAISQSLSNLPDQMAVVLEGFGDVEHDTGGAERLSRAGVSTVVCHRGRLDEAIASLEGTGPEG